MLRQTLTLLALLQGTSAVAQMLPAGTGAVAVGMRQFSPGTDYYDASGSFKPIGSKFDTDFSASQMASGALGSDLKTLYDELKKFDSANTGDKSLADQMNFGNLRGSVESNTSAQFLGVAYGATDNWTLFTGIPFIKATVDADLYFEGDNTASAVKARLGNLAFKDIQDGLTKASRLSTATIKTQVQDDYGYKPMDHWEYSGIGDFMLGARTELVHSKDNDAGYNLELSGKLEIPTGYADDPDHLTDASLGRGYYAPSVSAHQTVNIKNAKLGLETGVVFGVPTDTYRRVPEGQESLVSKDRKSKVHWIPGMETQTVGSIGTGSSLISGEYRLGLKEHFRDTYNGNLAGNYAALENESAQRAVFHEVSVKLSTVDSFLSGAFAVPVIVTLTGHETMAGRGTYKFQYVELSIASFFRTSSSPRTAEPLKPAQTIETAQPAQSQDATQLNQPIETTTPAAPAQSPEAIPATPAIEDIQKVDVPSDPEGLAHLPK